MKTPASTYFFSRATLTTMVRWALPLSAVILLQACAVIAVADAAVTVVATGVSVTAKTVGAVANAVIPGGGDED